MLKENSRPGSGDELGGVAARGRGLYPAALDVPDSIRALLLRPAFRIVIKPRLLI